MRLPPTPRRCRKSSTTSTASTTTSKPNAFSSPWGIRAKCDPSAALRDYWETRGIAFTGLRLIDGSGLARANMIRPLDLARINHAVRHGGQGARFHQSLSTYLGGNVRSKLGAMSGVKTEVGFLTLPDGSEFTFALMANGLGPDVDFWSVREKLLTAIRAAE